VIVKMTILRLLGSSDDKEKRGVARPVGPPLRVFRKGEEWKMQCKRMHGDRGRYLVNVGEKCNLMIPWTKVQIFHCSYSSNHTQAFVLQFFLQLVSRAFKMSIEMSSKQAK